MAHGEREHLISKIEEVERVVKKGAVYIHNKSGGRYAVVDIVVQEDNESVSIVYEELDYEHPITWVRSFDGPDGWATQTEINGEQVPRFTKVEE